MSPVSNLPKLAGPGCSCVLTSLHVCTLTCVFVIRFQCRAVVDKKPRKLQWKTPTYGPLVRPYHPYKEVSSSSERTGLLQPNMQWALLMLCRTHWYFVSAVLRKRAGLAFRP